MPIARRPDFIVSLAFAGALIWSGAIADPASAAETLAATLPHNLGCALVSPRFEPSARRRLAPQAASFVGGAKPRSLVGEPCLQSPRANKV